MPRVYPIEAISYACQAGDDLSRSIAPPYDVLDEESKAELLAGSERNISVVDLPHLPAKTLGPPAAYEGAGRTFRQWLADGTLHRRKQPAMFAYRQSYEVRGRAYRRCGLIANVRLQAFGPSPEAGAGGVFPHEQTFSEAKQDRLKLMQATGAQLSPIFGLHSDPDERILGLLSARMAETPSFYGTTPDDVLHEAWAIDDARSITQLQDVLRPADVFIADGHHRYTTALNYRQDLIDRGELAADDVDHRANFCLFVLVAMQDPGMIVLPTHRLLVGAEQFTVARFAEVASPWVTVTRFVGDGLASLEAALPTAGDHAVGLFTPGDPTCEMAIVTTRCPDPLADSHSHASEAWRTLDVAIVQHLLVERICQPAFGKPDQPIAYKFPHTLKQLHEQATAAPGQVGLVLQATPLESVMRVSEAGELMPQKSTFFYPKLATGLVINPIV